MNTFGALEDVALQALQPYMDVFTVGPAVPLPLKTALTTSSPEVWLVATSSKSWVVRGFRHPSLWIRDSQVVPERNALMTSTSTTSRRELHHWENLRM